MSKDYVLTIDGDKNIANCGDIKGDFLTGNKFVILNLSMNNTEQIEDFDKISEAISNISKSQLLLSKSISDQKEIDSKNADASLKMSEAAVMNAEAAKMNAEAFKNISQILLREDELLIKLTDLLDKKE